MSVQRSIYRGLFLAFLILTRTVFAQSLEVTRLSLTSPVLAGDDATLTVQSASGAQCVITVFTSRVPARLGG